MVLTAMTLPMFYDAFAFDDHCGGSVQWNKEKTGYDLSKTPILE
jgi:hypothetical protein